MTFIGGVRSPVHRCTGGDTVNEYFGPFNIGPGLRDGCGREVGEEGGDDYADMGHGCLEGVEG